MYTTSANATGTQPSDRRRNGRLREIYEDAAQQLHHLFKAHGDWVGSSIDFVALRLLHERYQDLTPGEVRSLVTSIGGRLRHSAGKAA